MKDGMYITLSVVQNGQMHHTSSVPIRAFVERMTHNMMDGFNDVVMSVIDHPEMFAGESDES